MIEDYIRFALSTMMHRRRRSWLTILGIFIGIAAVVALISVSQGLREAVTSQFELIGADVITIIPGKLGQAAPGFGAAPLTDSDLKVIEGVRGVGTAAAMLARQTKVTFSGEDRYVYVIGLPADNIEEIMFSMEGIRVIEGRLTTEADRFGAIMGYSVADDLFEKDVRIGDKLEVSGEDFKVRGRISKIGNRQDDTQVYIHLSTARDIFNASEEITTIILKVRPGADPERVAEDIKDALEDRRGEEDFSVMTASQLANVVQNILGIIQLVLVGIAAISLMVGGVGIMNTMYTSVQERTKQIGIMKAVGATNSDVLMIFLVESGLLGIVGGAIGCALGIALALGVEQGAAIYGFSALKASISAQLIAFALGFSFVLGVLSGVLPARHAARMNPVDALRYE